MIEIIATLIVISVLAAVAVSKYSDVSTEASQVITQSLAATLEAASAKNYAIRGEVASLGSLVQNCSDMADLLNRWPDIYATDYSIAGLSIIAETTEPCTVYGPNSSSAQFIGFGIN